MRQDRFTNTPEDAAAFERHFGPEYDAGDSPDYEFPDELDERWMDQEEADRQNGVVHPPHCTLPPGHPPYWSGIRDGNVLYENCEPAR